MFAFAGLFARLVVLLCLLNAVVFCCIMLGIALWGFVILYVYLVGVAYDCFYCLTWLGIWLLRVCLIVLVVGFVYLVDLCDLF